jgi:hypothetical protein
MSTGFANFGIFPYGTRLRARLQYINNFNGCKSSLDENIVVTENSIIIVEG